METNPYPVARLRVLLVRARNTFMIQGKHEVINMKSNLLRITSAATMAVLAGVLAFGPVARAGGYKLHTAPATAILDRDRTQLQTQDMLQDKDCTCDYLQTQDRIQLHDGWQD